MSTLGKKPDNAQDHIAVSSFAKRDNDDTDDEIEDQNKRIKVTPLIFLNK